MTAIDKQRGHRISPALEIRNRLPVQVEVQQVYGEVRINLSRSTEPVIVTLSPGRRGDGSGSP